MHGQILRGLAAYAAVAASAAVLASDANGGGLLDLAAPVERWEDGIPLGNGGAGALLWGGGDTLNVTLDRADFWHNVDKPCYMAPGFTWKNLIDVVADKDDARRAALFSDKISATKLPGVRLVLKLGEGQTLKRFRLDGDTASATVTVATPDGDRDVLAWFDDGDSLLSMRVPDGVAFAEKAFVRNASFETRGNYPEPEDEIDGGKAIYRRKRRTDADNRFDTDFEAGVKFRDASARPDSTFWRRFNRESSVSLPDEEMQRLYDMAIYLYGAGARAGNAPLALQDVRADDPAWKALLEGTASKPLQLAEGTTSSATFTVPAGSVIRTLRLPNGIALTGRWVYDPGIRVVLPAKNAAGEEKTLMDAVLPMANWQDNDYDLELSCNEAADAVSLTGEAVSTRARRTFRFLKSQVSPPEPAASKRMFRLLTEVARTSEPEVLVR